MADSLTISKITPSLKSMDYALMRETGINRLQELASSVWNDFNIHDPGVTILEALAYAITDLGYRSNYRMQDILAQDPSNSADIKNFFTAREILPNCPLTIQDYRKLLIDVEVNDTVNNCRSGVKNAWLFKSDISEQQFYVHEVENFLSYSPDPSIPEQDFVRLKGLYNVLLEFNECAVFGDLNENTLVGRMQIQQCVSYPMDANLLLKTVEIRVEFPRWDTAGINWSDPASIRSGIHQHISLEIFNLPDNYVVNYSVDANNTVQLSISVDVNRDGSVLLPLDVTCLQNDIEAFIYTNTGSLMSQYQKKVEMIFQILEKVRATLMANRNLCEDFFRFSAVKVEEIAMCGDIEVANDANIEEVLANIYHEIGKFFSPTVFFHTLDEMMARGKTPDQIFEGPRLEHGFIDDEELKKADLRQSVHVSDLYQIIMNVPGVIAVKNLQIANIPEDNDDNIPSKSVKWCLDLAFDKNYVPRLSIQRSNIAFFKDLLPFQADEVIVEQLLAQLQSQDPPQRLEDPVLDLPVPQGEFKSLDTYTSVQEEFPLVYGIGTAGLPDSANDLRKAQAHQLKGFLMFFDQLLADYLSQLSHVKDLFSMNETRDNDGNFIIDRSYFTQTLFNIVPHSFPDLYVNSQAVHTENLNLMAEDETLFESRRNKFLDHLLARFGETFSDYAMLTYTLAGPKAPEQLIEDKLSFLNDYPHLSSCRGAAFNYEERCHLWHIDNVSGLEERVSHLLGLKQKKLSDLRFFPGIAISDNNAMGPFSFTIENPPSSPLMDSNGTFPTLDEVNAMAEMAIVAGINFENYEIYSPGLGKFAYRLLCNGEIIARSRTITFPSAAAAEIEIKNLVIPVFGNELINNPESNRKNLSCFLENNLAVVISFPSPPPGCPPIFQIDFTLRDDFGNDIIKGIVRGFGKMGDGPPELSVLAQERMDDLILEFMIRASDRDNYRFELNGSGDYVFSVTDSCKDSMATSVETDFNTNLADFLVNGTVNAVSILGADGITTPGYTVNTAAEDDDKINLSFSAGPAIPSNAAKVLVDFTVMADMTAYRPVYKQFVVNTDLRGLLKEGEFFDALIDTVPFRLRVARVEIMDYTAGSYRTRITVFENLPTVASVFQIDHESSIDVLSVTNATDLVLTGGVDETALQLFRNFIIDRFLSHEGMHIVEHILLRPVIRTKIFQPATPATLTAGLPQQGNFFYVKTVPIIGANTTTRVFTLSGNLVPEIQFNQQVSVKNSLSGINDRVYTVLQRTFGVNTDIKVEESIGTAALPHGDLSYTRSLAITGIDAPNEKILIAGPDITGEIAIGDVVIISGSTDGKNDKRYTVLSLSYDNVNSQNEIVIDKVEISYNDNFLPINETSACEDCKYGDPYSFIASVILPYWQGRFSNQTFRRFVERTMRMECPAHIVLNFCWIDCEHMTEFEEKYKPWLFIHSQKTKDPVQLSTALNEFIDILQRTRSVFPHGTLHDCDVDDKLKNSVILNHTQIGTIN